VCNVKKQHLTPTERKFTIRAAAMYTCVVVDVFVVVVVVLWLRVKGAL